MGKRTQIDMFPKKAYRQPHEKEAQYINHQGNANPTTVRYHLITCQNGYY